MRGVRDDLQLVFLNIHAELGVGSLQTPDDIPHLLQTDGEDMSAENDRKRGWLKTALRLARRVMEEDRELEDYTVSHSSGGEANRIRNS